MSEFYQDLAKDLDDILEDLGFDVEIQKPVLTDDDYGASNKVWVSIGTVKFAWDTNSSKETIKRGKNESQASYTALISYRDDVALTDEAARARVLYNGTAFNIISSQIIGDKVGLKLMLEEGTQIQKQVDGLTWESLTVKFEDLK